MSFLRSPHYISREEYLSSLLVPLFLLKPVFDTVFASIFNRVEESRARKIVFASRREENPFFFFTFCHFELDTTLENI